MIMDIWQDIVDAGSAITSGIFAGIVQYGMAIALIVLTVGVILYFLHVGQKVGKSLIIYAVAGMAFVCALYMMAFSTNSLPDLSGIFVLPATGTPTP